MSRIAAVKFPVEFDPNLVEQSVLRVIEQESRAETTLFRCRRNEIYEVQDAELREARFRELHLRWFHRLNLGAPFFQVIQENPVVSANSIRCLVLQARVSSEEGADLYGSRTETPDDGAGRFVLGIRIQTTTLIDSNACLYFLRHELGHAADMVDRHFAYAPDLHPAGSRSAFDTHLRDRYLVLWDASIDGRLVAASLLPAEVKSVRRREFVATFPTLGESADAAFERVFSSRRPTHDQLIAFARHPEKLASH